MPEKRSSAGPRFTARTWRLIAYLIVLAGFAAWKFIPRPWHPSVTIETTHLSIQSSASQSQTEDTARVLELLYSAYSNKLGSLSAFQCVHPKLKVKLFKDRTEFRRINPGLGWAEAFYREPYCRAYFSAEEINPYHWMLHESVHQLNNEVAHLELAKWLEEGLADYFATSQVRDKAFVGRIDPNTYPVWWIDQLATSASLEENLKNGSVIPLRSIITNRGGPSMSRHFNLYYLHWWTLTHFLFEDPRYGDHALMLVERGGDLAAFEQAIGPVDRIQQEWHDYVRKLKMALPSDSQKRGAAVSH